VDDLGEDLPSSGETSSSRSASVLDGAIWSIGTISPVLGSL
jgi:hypothetical protein